MTKDEVIEIVCAAFDCWYGEYSYIEDWSKEFAARDMVLYAFEHEQKWISVGKQLPETDGMYLVTTTGTHNDVVDIAYYYKDIGFHKASRVLAWMPLPEPYKAESEVQNDQE